MVVGRADGVHLLPVEEQVHLKVLHEEEQLIAGTQGAVEPPLHLDGAHLVRVDVEQGFRLGLDHEPHRFDGGLLRIVERQHLRDDDRRKHEEGCHEHGGNRPLDTCVGYRH